MYPNYPGANNYPGSTSVYPPTTPGYGAPYSGYSNPMTSGSFSWPNNWNRYQYNYGGNPYIRQQAYMPPMGVSPQIANLFMQASQIFRNVDTNWSGALDKKEFKRAMMMLGMTFNPHEAKHLFYLADTDHSGRINEREFCEFWVWMMQQRQPQMYPSLY